jgi:hypothetical protein
MAEGPPLSEWPWGPRSKRTLPTVGRVDQPEFCFGSGRSGALSSCCPSLARTKNKPSFFPKRLYRGRARIEQAIGKLKRFKRIAMRCEKTPESFAAFVAFACGLILVKSVHRA